MASTKNINKFKDKFSKKQNTIAHNRQLDNGTIVQVAGIIEEVKVITTRRGGYMAFVRLADFSDKIEIVVFSETWNNYKNLLILDQCVVVQGKISQRQGEISLLLEKAKKLESETN